MTQIPQHQYATHGSPQFISFEGTEGVGKTTAINNICQQLTNHGIEYICTREPGGSDFAETLREILLNPATDINDDTELLLLFAARSDHIDKVIKPALAAGKWVICDRFIDSTIAYQGFGRCQKFAINEQPIADNLTKITTLIKQFVTVIPNKTLWLDLPVLEGIERAGKRSAADRFEQETVEFFERVYQGYEYMAQSDSQRFIRVDATGCADEVATRLWQEIITDR